MDKEITILLREANRKLGVMIALLANALPQTENAVPLKEKIRLLSQCGLQPSEIAAILNKSPNHINKELTLLRRAKK